MGGVDRTDQLMQPYDMARKSLKWYKKLACHFLQLAMLNSFLVYKKDCGRKRFLEFQHDVISVLLFGTENDQPDIPREENVVRLTERHFLEQIPPTANKRKAQKRCRYTEGNLLLLPKLSIAARIVLLPLLRTLPHKVCVLGQHLKDKKDTHEKILVKNFITKICGQYFAISLNTACSCQWASLFT